MTFDDTNPAARWMKFGRDLLDNIRRNCARSAHVLLCRPKVRLPPVGKGTVFAAIVALFAVFAAMFIWDAAATDWARHLPPWVTAAHDQITDFGLAGWFLYPFGFVLVCLAVISSPVLSRSARAVCAMLAVRFGFLFLAIGVPGLFVAIVKRMIGRARPYHLGPYDDPFAYAPFAWRPEYASMPSGHATTAAAAAVAIGAVWPRARGVLWLYALIIMVSRVAVLAHRPSDVMAGALVGIVGACLVRRWFAARRLMFSADLRTFPWPRWRRIKAAMLDIAAWLLGRGEASRVRPTVSIEPGIDGL